MNSQEFNRVLESVRRWVERRNEIVALGLAGSWARGAARVDSDIDLVFLTEDPDSFRRSTEWLDEIAWEESGFIPSYWNDEDWGNIWCRRVYFAPSTEVEFNFGSSAWACVDPVAEDTRRIVTDGFQIIVDKQGILSALVETLSRFARVPSADPDP